MSNPYPSIPRDRGSSPMVEYPAAVRANARYASENSTASSVISVAHTTTMLELSAIGGAAVMRWVATTDTEASVISIAGATSNFDHVIPAGTMRKFAIPQERISTYAQSVQGVNRAEGLYQRIAIKSVGVASVLVSEF